MELGTPSNYNQYGHSNNQNEKDNEMYPADNNDSKIVDEITITPIIDYASKTIDSPRAPSPIGSAPAIAVGDDDYADDDFEADS